MSELEAAKKKLDQAKARYQKAQIKERQKSRKEDARRKIIIGGAMLALLDAQKDPDRRAGTVRTILKYVSEKDRPLVEAVLRGS
ncbi:mobilization protein [Sulfitobacter sp. 915]|jgi:hypothetical protein|uniref:mobilization protein n=1 Tax=Sulfitobacter sp. 915 TaxID=3368558 RepID=UPI0037475ED7|tara:strand:- start:240 stop:491 length:252 start_codon:yes stop_codon:yes gene_type:complete